VQPGLAQLGLFEQPLPLVVVGVRVERLAVRGSEDPALLVPDLARTGAFLLLLGPVSLKRGWMRA